MKFVYCGYDFFWNVLDRMVAGGHELLQLYSFPTDNYYDFNAQVSALAQRAAAPLFLSPITRDSIASLARRDRQLLICATYPYKVPAEVIASFDHAVNIHPSLLPDGRGPWPPPWIILRGLSRSGVTLHKLNDAWDRGDIVLQREVAVSPEETLESLSAKFQLAAGNLIEDYLRDPVAAERNATPQGTGSYWARPTQAERTLQWDGDVRSIHTVVRAFGKFESFAWIEGRRYLVRDVTVWREQHAHAPGTVVHRMNREMVIAARDGYVCLRDFNPAPVEPSRP
jgi:methionyl-tRNA formyltransferase